MSSVLAGSRPVLTVEALAVNGTAFAADIVADISFSVAGGETLALVGESGSGKTTVALALLGYAQPGTAITAGAVRIAGTDLLSLPPREQRAWRGRRISYVPQDPSTGLSPGMRVGEQVAEIVRLHLPEERSVAERVRRAFERAQLPTGADFLRRYPHQLSGGQQQRVAIAMTLVCDPDVVVMDEPTTGLDVTTQARLLATVEELLSERDLAVVYVSHDLGVVRNLADRVAVMYGGRLLEEAPVEELFAEPRHPYTRRLLEAVPRVDAGQARSRGIPGSAVEPWNRPAGCPFAPRCDARIGVCTVEMPPPEVEANRVVRCWNWQLPGSTRPLPLLSEASGAPAPQRDGGPVLEVVGLSAGYGPRDSRLRGAAQRLGVSSTSRGTLAVDDVSFSVGGGSCVAVVGESGSGKTTLLRTICGLHQPLAGEIRLRGNLLAAATRQRPLDVRRAVQLVPQNPYSSLNPKHTVGTIIGRPLRLFHGVRGRRASAEVARLLERVHLRPATAARYPRDLSGGEKQRVAIARALAAQPEILLCDEITAALDVAVQAGILDLILELRATSGTTVLFVTHDLAVVREISEHVIVMRQGRIREAAPAEAVFERPSDDYTRELLSAVPRFREHDYPTGHPQLPLEHVEQ
jgi:peptide/nickel transport system ATP-binding protein